MNFRTSLPRFSVSVLATVAIPFSAFALSTTEAVEMAYKEYKKTGVVPNDLISDSFSNLIKLNEDCGKRLEQLAMASMSPEHQREFGPQGMRGFASDLGGPFSVSGIMSVVNAARRLSGNMTDNDQKFFALEVGRGAAVRYRAERCGPTTRDTSVAGAVATGAAPSPPPSSSAPNSGGSDATSSSEADQRQLRIEQSNDGGAAQRRDATKLDGVKIGMTTAQVVSELGLPDDQSFNSTLKSVFWFKASPPDRYRLMYLYKGLGRLTFSSVADANAGVGEMHLTEIFRE